MKRSAFRSRQGPKSLGGALIFVVGMLALLCGPRLLARAEEATATLVVALTDEDFASAERLRELVDAPLALMRAPGTSDPSAARGLATQHGSELVAIIDGASRRVHVVRVSDGMVLTRELAPSSPGGYTAAFVAAELLTLAGQLTRPARPPPRASFGLGAGIDLALLAPYSGRPRATLQGALSLSPTAPRGLELALAAAIRKRARNEAEREEVTLRQSDLVLRAGPGWRFRPLHVSAFGQLGAALTRAELVSAGRDRTQVALAVGAGTFARIRLWSVLYLFGTALVASHWPRREYRVQGVRVARDGLLEAQLEAGLFVYLHSR
jgi:hypothetical protein